MSIRDRLRPFLVAVLVLLTCLTVTAAAAGFWLNRNVLKTSVWVKRVGPLPQDPAVQEALTRELTKETMSLIDPAALFSEALPERGRILAVPLSGAVERFVSERIQMFLASDTFSRLWTGLNERAHRQAVSALRGESELIEAREQAVVINLVPVVNGLVKEFSSITPELFGRKIDVPELSPGVLPDEARQALGNALGRQLPDDFGAIPIYEATQLRTAQAAVQAFDRFYALAAIVSLLLVPLTLWLSHRRRRTALQMIFGVSVGIVLIRRAAFWVEEDVLAAVREDNRAAAGAVLRAFLDPLVRGSAVVLAVLVVLAAVLVLTGGYGWAIRVRRGLSGLLAGGWVADGGGEPSGAAAVWVRDHREVLQIGGVAVVVLGLAVFDVSWPVLIVLLALLVAYEAAVLRAAASAASEPESPASPTAVTS